MVTIEERVQVLEAMASRNTADLKVALAELASLRRAHAAVLAEYRSRRCRFDESDIQAIRSAPESVSSSDLAKQHGMSRSHVSRIRRGHARRAPPPQP